MYDPHSDVVNRRFVLFMALLGGFWGAHKFALRARREAWIYLALSWTGISAFAGVIDLAILAFSSHQQGFFPRRSMAKQDVVEPSTLIRLMLGALAMAALIGIGIQLDVVRTGLPQS